LEGKSGEGCLSPGWAQAPGRAGRSCLRAELAGIRPQPACPAPPHPESDQAAGAVGTWGVPAAAPSPAMPGQEPSLQAGRKAPPILQLLCFFFKILFLSTSTSVVGLKPTTPRSRAAGCTSRAGQAPLLCGCLCGHGPFGGASDVLPATRRFAWRPWEPKWASLIWGQKERTPAFPGIPMGGSGWGLSAEADPKEVSSEAPSCRALELWRCDREVRVWVGDAVLGVHTCQVVPGWALRVSSTAVTCHSAVTHCPWLGDCPRC